MKVYTIVDKGVLSTLIGGITKKFKPRFMYKNLVLG